MLPTILPSARPAPSRLRAAAAALILFPVLAGAGCSSPRWRRDVIYTAGGVALYREFKLEEGARVPLDYKHPVTVPKETMAAMMARLTYEEGHLFRKSETLPVFKPEEVAAAAEPVSLALGAIAPDERLRFLVTHRRWLETLTGVHATTGVMFSTSEGILQVAFDNVRQSIGGADGGDPRDVSFTKEPTEMTDAAPVHPIFGSRHHVDAQTGSEHPRWLEVEIASVTKGPPPVAAAQAQASTPGAAPPAAQPGTGSAPAESDEARYQRLRARINDLKRLRAEGAITEEEYTRLLQGAIAGREE